MHLHERLEDGLQLPGRDALTRVAHVQMHHGTFGVVSVHFTCHADRTAAIGELHRVREKVQQYLPDLLSISPRDHIARAWVDE